MVLIQPLQNPQLLSFNICLPVSSDTTGYVLLQVWSRNFENLCVLPTPFNSCPQDNVFKNPEHKLRAKDLRRTYVNLVREYELPHFPLSCRELFFKRVWVFTVYVRHTCQVMHSSVHVHPSGASTQPEIPAVNQFMLQLQVLYERTVFNFT
jgi:hypothetical protein